MSNRAPKLTGKVKWWNVEKCFGFIGHGDTDYFVHMNDLKNVKSLRENETVKFYPLRTQKGRRAQEVEIVEVNGNC